MQPVPLGNEGAPSDPREARTTGASGDGEVLRCAFGDQAAWASAASTDSRRAWILCFLV